MCECDVLEEHSEMEERTGTCLTSVVFHQLAFARPAKKIIMKTMLRLLPAYSFSCCGWTYAFMVQDVVGLLCVLRMETTLWNVTKTIVSSIYTFERNGRRWKQVWLRCNGMETDGFKLRRNGRLLQKSCGGAQINSKTTAGRKRTAGTNL